jgi:hypothetical protein
LIHLCVSAGLLHHQPSFFIASAAYRCLATTLESRRR